MSISILLLPRLRCVLSPPLEYCLPHILVHRSVLCLPVPFLNPSLNSSSSSRFTNCFSKPVFQLWVSLAIPSVKALLLLLLRMGSHGKTYNYLDAGKATLLMLTSMKFTSPTTSKGSSISILSYSCNLLPSTLWACPNPTYRDIRPMACRDLQRDSREGMRFGQYEYDTHE